MTTANFQESSVAGSSDEYINSPSPVAGDKRPAGISPEWSPSFGSERDGHARKRSRTATHGHGATTPKPYLIIHNVICHRTNDHGNHLPSTLFLDRPRLLDGDCKMTALRGENPLLDLNEYLAEHPDLIFTVRKTYRCGEYHEMMEDAFENLLVPRLDPAETVQLRPYFSVLQQDGPYAESAEEHMQILSKDLIHALNKLNVPMAPSSKYDPPLFHAPYIPFFHLRKARGSLQVSPGDDHWEPLSLLFDYLESDFGNQYASADELFARGMVSLDHFPKLFRANDVVIAKEDEQPVAFLIKNHHYMNGSVYLTCYQLKFDGAFKRAQTEIKIEWPARSSREMPITSLSAYPLRFSDPSVKGRLVNRGRIFWKCRKRRFVSYTAPSRTFEIQVANPRYMIDMDTYKESILKEDDTLNHQDDGLSQLDETSSRQDEFETVDINQDCLPDEDFVILLPPKILGFGLHDKKWKNLLVEYIKEINWNKSAFDRLVLAPNKKRLITAMVKEHVLADPSADVIEGKGNGLIILLHGGPGTGKTLTAESVAEVAEKPLYRVTCGDIGTNAEAVEKYLESVLYIATLWEAVVLFDESDVFLEERTKADLHRNALVSVFLRVLEYYNGILILTTNRVGTFDEAFTSRVQLALHYPKLDEDGRLQIWNSFIYSLDNQGLSINGKQLKEKMEILARKSLNGRQIRNAIRTARQLASQDREPLSYEHLSVAIDISLEFDRYITNTRGPDDDFARAQNLRS